MLSNPVIDPKSVPDFVNNVEDLIGMDELDNALAKKCDSDAERQGILNIIFW